MCCACFSDNQSVVGTPLAWSSLRSMTFYVFARPFDTRHRILHLGVLPDLHMNGYIFLALYLGSVCWVCDFPGVLLLDVWSFV